MSIAPGNQAYAFNSAGFSWQLLQALQYLRVRRVGHRDTSLENPVLSRSFESHGFRYGLPDFSRESCAAVRMHTDPESYLPRRLKCTPALLTRRLLVTPACASQQSCRGAFTQRRGARHRLHHGERCLHRAYLRRVLVPACNRRAAVSGSPLSRS